MTIKTKVEWGPDANNDDWDPATMARKNKMKEFIVAGATTTDAPRAESDGVTFTRIWSNREAATEWVDFLNSSTPAPISAVVVEE